MKNELCEVTKEVGTCINGDVSLKNGELLDIGKDMFSDIIGCVIEKQKERTNIAENAVEKTGETIVACVQDLNETERKALEGMDSKDREKYLERKNLLGTAVGMAVIGAGCFLGGKLIDARPRRVGPFGMFWL